MRNVQLDWNDLDNLDKSILPQRSTLFFIYNKSRTIIITDTFFESCIQNLRGRVPQFE